MNDREIKALADYIAGLIERARLRHCGGFGLEQEHVDAVELGQGRQLGRHATHGEGAAPSDGQALDLEQHCERG